MQYVGGRAVQKRYTISADTDVQYGSGTSSVWPWRRHTISMEEAHLQYRCSCAVGRRHTISIDAGADQSHHQYARGCAVQDY